MKDNCGWNGLSTSRFPLPRGRRLLLYCVAVSALQAIGGWRATLH
jgi:hypothetical protein